MTVQDRDHSCGLICCWMCGAQDGDYDAFVGTTALLCFMEPLDARFPRHAGYQVTCNVCAVGGLSYDGASIRQNHIAVRAGGRVPEIAYSPQRQAALVID